MQTYEVMATPIGLLSDLIACHQISQGAKMKEVVTDDDLIPDLL